MERSGRRVLLRALAAVGAATALLLGAAVVPASADTVSSIRATEWWLDSMQASTMWKTSTGSGITVAVIDSGVKADHPDLKGKVLQGKNFSPLAGGATTDVDGHGTGMASLIVGTGKGWDGQGMVGLAPGTKVLPVRVVGQGDNQATEDADFARQLSAAVRYAADSDAKILSISMGQQENEPNVSSAISYALAKGKLIVASSGNNALRGNIAEYPGAFSGVVDVGSVDQHAKIAAYSQYGSQVVLSAPGENVHTACLNSSGYCLTGGTSDATAIVSASAALLWSVHPSWTANQIIRVLMDTTSDSTNGQPAAQDPHYGYGIVRPRIALTNPGNPGPADVNPLSGVSTSSTADPSASTAASAGASAAPTAGASTTASSTAPSTTAAKRTSSSSSLLWIGLGVAAVVVVGVVVFLILRRRNRPGAPPPPSTPLTYPNPYSHIPDPYRR
jgi:type VII secretion-associated serine protease mycosin